MKQRLIFDTTDAFTKAETDNVGAYLRAADGTLLTSNGTALNTYLTNGSIAVTSTDLDIRDLAFATDKVDVSGSSVTVSATNLDIRDLAFATDKVDVSGSSVTVSATNLDIRDLAAASDSVSAWTKDGSGNSINSTSNALNVYVTGSGALTVNDAALANTSILASKTLLAAADTPEDIVAAPLAGRKYLYIYNNDNRVMYIGESGVSSATGFPILPGAMIEMRCGFAVDVEWVSSKLSHDLRALQLS